MCATASASVCAVKFVNSFARRQHLFYIKGGSTLQWSAEVTGHHKAQVPGDVDSNFLSYPASLSLFQLTSFAQNVISYM